MPRYYFEVGGVLDEQGCEFFDVDGARAEARRLLSIAVKRADIQTGECKAWSCVVRDERGMGIIRIVVATLVEALDAPIQGGRLFQSV